MQRLLAKNHMWINKAMSSINCWTYNVPKWMGFDWVLSCQWETTEDDEEEDEVGKVGMVNEIVASDPEAGRIKK